MNAFPHYPQRPLTVLDGLWEFSWQGDQAPFAEIDPTQAVFRQTASVPGVFDTLPDTIGKRGTGIYRTKVRLPPGPPTRKLLQLDGLGLRGRVFWDGLEVASSELPYSPLQVLLEAVSEGCHELVIACDNRFASKAPSLFNPDFDFYGYGGIYRSARLHHLPDCAFDRIRVTPLDVAEGRVRLDMSFLGTVPETLDISLAFDDAAPSRHRLSITNGKASLIATVPDAHPWTPQSPHLHTVTASITDDQVIERFGLRRIEALAGRLLLNGEPLQLFGFNRHEAHPEFGPALPEAEMVRDLQFMRDMGCNFVRGAHYPQHQSFLDLCDQMGFLVWEESLGWGDHIERLVNPHFAALQEAQTRLMVRTSFNHPSVIFWAFLNEGASDHADSKPLYQQLARAIREEDTSRLVTYASNRCERDLSFCEVDVVSMNLYPAWIDSPDWVNVQPFERIRAMIRCMVEFCEAPEYKDKPFLLSEIGTCSLYGWHDPHRAGWSEEYHADYLKTVLDTVRAEPRLSGVAIWQLTDTRSFSAGNMRSKARGFNNAGVLDEYRRPKLAYHAVKEALTTGSSL